ncbi:MAG TPA: YkgJ family cysteine cluster protein [Fibrobacteraceae bacterium]|nr:YkgJ family cysteine cluster protein [Fibrobacteraceae bacterium]
MDFSQDLGRFLQFFEDFQGIYESWQREALRQMEPICCAKGCGNCCQHYPVSVEPFESLALYYQLRQRDDFACILEECFRRVRAFQNIQENGELTLENEDQADAALQSYFVQGLRCPFLDKHNGCSVHQWRPVTCRMYFSLTPGEFCTPEHLLTPSNRSFHLCLPDVIEEDIAEIGEFWANLEIPEGLYAAMLSLNYWEGMGVFKPNGLT